MGVNIEGLYTIEDIPLADDEPPDASGDPLARFVFDDDAPLEPPDDLIRDTLPKQGLGFLGGQSGAGKSFVAVHMSICLATGRRFFGREIAERVGTVIVAAEGAGGMRARIRAAREAAGIADPLPVAFMPAPPVLSDEREMEPLADALAAVSARFLEEWGVRLGCVVVDTLAAGASLEDENDNAEAARVARILRDLGERAEAVVLAVHHYGKAAETGLRGASAWRAAADVVIAATCDRDEVTGAHGNRRIAVTKNREGAEGEIGPFELRHVPLGNRPDGTSWGSAVVEEGEPGAGAVVTTARASRGVQVLVEAVTEALAAHGETHRVRGDGPEVQAVQVHHVRDEFCARYVTGEDDPAKARETARKAFQRALKAAPGSIGRENRDGFEWLWLARDIGT